MIAAITSSGRVNSNSSFLLGKALEAADSGKGSALFDLSKLSFKGCLGCGACRSGAGSCIILDDLTEVLQAVATSRAVILASPNYYGYTSGIFKAFLDRWYSFRDGERKLRLPDGRPLLFIFSQGHPDPSAYSQTVSSFEKIFTGYGFSPEILVAAGLEKAGSSARNPELIKKALEMGARLRTN
jgi:multimeric flavodoxin WrbA